jgi:hypothetical protein
MQKKIKLIFLNLFKILYRKFKTFLRISFLDNYTKDYIEVNKKIFENKTSTNPQGVILLDFFDWYPFIFFWSILVNYIKKKNNYKICFFYFPIYNRFTEKFFFFKRRLLKIYGSFGCKVGITTLGKSINSNQKKNYNFLFYEIKSKSDLLAYSYKDIKIGDLIYDTVLRTYSLPTFNMDSPLLKKIFNDAHFIADLIEDYFNNNQVKYVVVSDVCYNSFGIITRYSHKRGIKVLHLSSMGKGCTNYRLKFYNPKIYSTRNPYYDYKDIFSKLSIDEQKIGINLGKQLLLKRISGDIYSGIEYMPDSPFNQIKVFKKKFFEQNSFKVLLCAHNFFDNPHKYRDFYYNDYIDWIIETLKILTDHKINIYIKWHPIAYQLSSEKIAKKILRPYFKNKKNIIELEDNINYYELLKNNLDWAITVNGTVANELPYFGVKILCCGDNPHINYNFAITPKSRLDYEERLKNLKKNNYLINKEEIYQFYFMNYIFFNQKNFKNKIDETNYVYQKEKRLDIHLNSSSKYFEFAKSQILTSNVIEKTEAYISEFLERGDSNHPYPSN